MARAAIANLWCVGDRGIGLDEDHPTDHLSGASEAISGDLTMPGTLSCAPQAMTVVIIAAGQSRLSDGCCAISGPAREGEIFGLNMDSPVRIRDLYRKLITRNGLRVGADCVYDPTRGDNEERSADAASAELAALGRDGPFIGRVRELILATKHSARPETGDAGIVADIDLSILGKAPDVFDAYDRAIRREYGHVDGDAFAAGRARVLRNFLARPAIYSTTLFLERYERAARENLARAVARWEKRIR